ncbi:cytochrome b [Gymnodinialimonas hymeniacidonis]|uniref:cytochrome b n=1 Tax=Gymnodinialimonas hymeniacidonis TaxID=3126508 RepID=UPI0034C69F3F
MKSTAETYGGMARLIHWASALLIITLVGSGFRAGFATDPEVKLSAWSVHVPVAVFVLLLTVFRLIWWLRFDRKPGPVGGVPAWQETAAHWTHRALYLLIFVMLASGIAMSVMSGLPDAIFGTAPMPELADLPPRAAHGIGGRLIAAAILLHAGAAIYHHLILKDRTLTRMVSGR